MNVSCLVRGVWPLPQVRLTLGEFDLGQVCYFCKLVVYLIIRRLCAQDNTEILVQPLSYDVVIFKLVPAQNLSSGRGVFGCEARLPGTPYLARQEASSCSCRTLHIKDRRQRIWRKQAAALVAGGAK